MACWVNKLPLIMLMLNSDPHGPHSHSIFMVTTSHETLPPPNLAMGVNPSSLAEAFSSYFIYLRYWLQKMHDCLAPSEAPTTSNPYRENDLLWVTTTHPRQASNLPPR